MVPEGRVNIGILGEMHVMMCYWKHRHGPPGVTPEINARWSTDTDTVVRTLNRGQRYRAFIKDFLERNEPIRTARLKGLDVARTNGPDALGPEDKDRLREGRVF
jgi:hypothetical protein